jgi:hypothetical protein
LAAELAIDEFAGDELAIDEARVALKLGGKGDPARALASAGAAGNAAGMRMASTCIGAPRDLMHSMRQCRKP